MSIYVLACVDSEQEKCSSCFTEPFLYIYRQLIYNYPEQLFGAAGVMAIEHADFAGVERLALVTGMGKRH